MTPFKLTAQIQTPIIIGKRAPNLAGLLYHCCLLHTGSQEGASELLESLLRKSDGVFHASNLIFGVDYFQTLIAGTVSTTGAMRPESDLSTSKIKPNNAKGTGYSKIQTEGGAYRNRLRHYDTYHAKSIVFFGCGDMAKIQRLLDYYVFSIGDMANMGIGNIHSWDCSETDNDQSFFMPDMRDSEKQILVNRLPVHLAGHQASAKKEVCSLVPPFYKEQPQSQCYIPNRILKIAEI